MLIDDRRSDTPDPPPPRPGDGTSSEISAYEPSPAGRGAALASGRMLLAQVLLALAVALGLSSEGLVSTAERQPFGPRRTIALTAATALHDQVSTYRLDRPAAMLRSATGRETREPDRAPPTIDPPAGPGPVEESTEPAPARRSSDELVRPTPSETDVGVPRSPNRPPTASAEGSQQEAAAPPPPRTVDTENKLVIWAGGDSLGEYIGNHLVAALVDEDLVSVELDYRISTGLARPDYHDWPAQLAEVAGADPPPDAMLFMVGGNDNQNMERSGQVLPTGSTPWYSEYEARIESIVDVADPTATQVYWIGLPPMRDDVRHALSLGMNDAARRVADRHANMTYVDIDVLFSGPDGGYSPHVPAPDGQLRLARQADGVHMTFAGSTWVAAKVWDLMQDRWAIGPGAGQPEAPQQQGEPIQPGNGVSLPR